MRSPWWVRVAGLAVVALFSHAGLEASTASAKKAQTPAAPSAAEQQVVLQKYCYGCHNQRTKSGNLVLEGLDVARAPEHPEVWEKVIQKLRGGVMPPRGLPRPDPATYRRVASALETEIDRAAAAKPWPGEKPTLHRLNRVEYENAVRDVLGLGIDATEYLPTDATTGGFDNVATALTMSPTLMERYISAAEKISRLAVGGAPLPTEAVYTVRPEMQFNRHVDGLTFGTRGGTLVRHTFPVDAEYEFLVQFHRAADAENTDMTSRQDAREQQVEVTLDGVVVKTHVIDSTGRGATNSLARAERGLEFRIPVKAGPHDLGVSFVVSPSAVGYSSIVRPPYARGFLNVALGTAPLLVDVSSVKLTGPLNPTGPGDTPSRRRIFVCSPAHAADERTCADKIMRNLARHAYRRPANDSDLAVLLAAYDRGRTDGGFERGIETAVSQLLMSPKFLFRLEADRTSTGTPAGTGGTYRLSNLEMASRLSFFLWSSVPDNELLEAARRGELRSDAGLGRQVRRMLADDRGNALVENFVGQWLLLRTLPALGRDSENFPNFDESLRDAFSMETRLFFRSILREDRSALDVIRADYTFLNDRLARHYGIPNVQGSHFRRVTFPDSKRRGILGQGSLLMVTSQPNRTSPVLRGKWIMENILGTPPPPPPANVPPLKEPEGSTEKPKTMRERMAAHRANPVCASCHAMLDPLGFALENFDASGQWRDVDGAFVPVDASGSMPDGTAFSNINQFYDVLAAQSENFALAFTQRLMTYALGRIVDYRDMPVVRKIVRDSARTNYRMSSLILGILKSVPFQMRSSES